MANKKASKKDIKRITVRRNRNKKVKSSIKTLLKILQENKDQESARKYVSALDKAAKRSIITKNKADRQKSAVSKYLFGSAEKSAAPTA